MSFQNPVHNKHQSSTSMVLLKYLALAFLVALPAQTNAAARCLNSDTFRKEVDGVPRSCVWIRFLESRRVEHCVDPEVLNECPQTCGQCCDNDRTYKFMTSFDKTVNCKWISKNAKKIEIRRATWCGLTFKNDVNVRDGRYCLQLKRSFNASLFFVSILNNVSSLMWLLFSLFSS